MPKIDFYILPTDNNTARLQFVCRLIEKAYKNRHRIYVHTDQAAIAHTLDELLWTYRDDSFLPHNLYGEGPDPAPPIQIGINQQPQKHRDILINLTEHIPTFFHTFTRVCELVLNEPAQQELARERFRNYRAQGNEITTHKLQTIES